MAAGHILVADDDAAIRTVLSQALTRAGYEVRVTGTAGDRKSTRLNSSHVKRSRMPSSA